MELKLPNLTDIISKNIIQLRKKVGWTQVKISQEAGITSAAVSMIEAGKRVPSLPTLIKISNSLNVPIQDIIEIEIIDSKSKSFYRKFKSIEVLKESDQKLILSLSKRLGGKIAKFN